VCGPFAQHLFVRGSCGSTEETYDMSRHISCNTPAQVQIQSRPKSQFEVVPQDTEESEFLDFVDFKVSIFSGNSHMSPYITSILLQGGEDP